VVLHLARDHAPKLAKEALQARGRDVLVQLGDEERVDLAAGLLGQVGTRLGDGGRLRPLRGDEGPERGGAGGGDVLGLGEADAERGRRREVRLGVRGGGEGRGGRGGG